MEIISDIDAIQYLLTARGRFAVYVGAGVSAEAGVMTAKAICVEIRERLRRIHLGDSATPREITRWENDVLRWNDPAERYLACIYRGYPTKAARVDFFRSKLLGKKPSFSHHAIAMLMSSGYLKSTGITTNFDKLLESAFIQQGQRECQAIRNDAETQYWRNDPERCYAVKLHGDYDTNNILNTTEETIAISESMKTILRELLLDSGLVVLGTAGQEKSIYSLFDDLGLEVAKAQASAGSLMSYGLLWGVFMGPQKPLRLSRKKLEELVTEKIESDEVGRDIAGMMSRLAHIGHFRFFPIWGSGDFLFDLINATGDKALQGTAELYLDHEIRLRHLFTRKGLPQQAITKHILSLDRQRRKLDDQQRSPYPETVLRARKADTSIEVRILYGDITKRSYMEDPEFSLLRRAVVSPEDTFLSTGGGVAFRLLDKAGPFFVLNELAKFAPIDQGTVAVTSGGKLPLHYVFHAATLDIRNDGSYAVSEEDVYRTMLATLTKAAALDVAVLWLPLLGAGVASLDARQSLEGVLRAMAAWQGRLIVLIFIYQEKVLSRQDAQDCLQRKLGLDYVVERL